MTTQGEERERELDAPRQRGRIPADTLPNRLTLARKLAGVSIREAADLCGFGRGAWTNWERGARPLDFLEITGIIAEQLDVDLEWLRFGGPLEGPRGRRVRPSTERSTPTIPGYSPMPARPIMTSDERPDGGYSPSPNKPRPTTTRPRTDRKNVGPDRRQSTLVESARTRRPVRVG
jgi:transcriptional regulator with XRE-family HTH domain